MSTLVIIPTLKEYDNLIKLIPEIFSYVPDAKILISDDDSQDKTEKLASENVAILKRHENFGYGKAILDGFKYAIEHGFGLIITMDADFLHDPKELPALLEKLKIH